MIWPSFRGNPFNTGESRIRFSDFPPAGREIRSIELGGLIWGTPISDGNGRIFVGSTNKRFYRVDVGMTSSITEPQIVWSYRINNRADALIDSAGSLHPTMSQVVVPGGDGFMHALNTETGAPQWTFHASGATEDMHASGIIVNSFEGNVCHSKDGTRVYAGCDNGHVYCVDASTGSEIWRFQANVATMIWTVIALWGDFVLFGALDGYLYVVHAVTGKLVDRYHTGGEIKSSPVVAGDMIFVANSNGTVHCLAFNEQHRLSMVWVQKELGAEIYSSPALQGDRLVVATMNGEAAGLDVISGEIVWRTHLGAYTTSSPVITADGVIVIGNAHGRLVALDVKTGVVRGCVVLSKGSVALNCSPLILETGEIVIGSYDGFLYIVPCEVILSRRDALSRFDANQVLQRTSMKDSLIESFRLNAPRNGPGEDGSLDPDAAIDPNGLRVTRMDGSDVPLPYEWYLSPDGRYINFVPRSAAAAAAAGAQPTPIPVHVEGHIYRLSNSWFRDRINFRRTGTFSVDIALGGNAIPAGEPVIERVMDTPLRLDIHRMFMAQPQILDTYIPAAMAAQGFVATVLDIDPIKRKFIAVLAAAIPDDFESFEIIPEPGKVVLLDGSYAGSVIELRARRGFTISSMGGTFDLSVFRVYGRLDPDTLSVPRLEFYARTSCLKIKGNGQSYEFSKDVVNQLCDRWMNVHMVGGAHARSNYREVSWDYQGPSTPPGGRHLVVHVDSEKGLFEARTAKAPMDRIPSPCPTHTLVDGRVWLAAAKPGTTMSPGCWRPLSEGDGIISIDAFFVRQMFGPLIRACCRWSIHPNVITLSSIVVTIGLLWARTGRAWLVPLGMIYKWFADAIDGPVARACGKSSRLGGFLDSLADIIFTVVAYVLCTERWLPHRGDRFKARLWMEGALLAFVTFGVGVLVNGIDALVNHQEFKNNKTIINRMLWWFSENSFAVIGGLALAYGFVSGTPMSRERRTNTKK